MGGKRCRTWLRGRWYPWGKDELERDSPLLRTPSVDREGDGKGDREGDRERSLSRWLWQLCWPRLLPFRRLEGRDRDPPLLRTPFVAREGGGKGDSGRDLGRSLSRWISRLCSPRLLPFRHLGERDLDRRRLKKQTLHRLASYAEVLQDNS